VLREKEYIAESIIFLGLFLLPESIHVVRRCNVGLTTNFYRRLCPGCDRRQLHLFLLAALERRAIGRLPAGEVRAGLSHEIDRSHWGGLRETIEVEFFIEPSLQKEYRVCGGLLEDAEEDEDNVSADCWSLDDGKWSKEAGSSRLSRLTTGRAFAASVVITSEVGWWVTGGVDARGRILHST